MTRREPSDVAVLFDLLHGNLTMADLTAMPTIHQGQYANLKADTGTMRLWLSRMTAEDGETQPVQIEALIGGRWVDVTERYAGMLR